MICRIVLDTKVVQKMVCRPKSCPFVRPINGEDDCDTGISDMKEKVSFSECVKNYSLAPTGPAKSVRQLVYVTLTISEVIFRTGRCSAFEYVACNFDWKEVGRD